jgi:hypothetical protein
VERKPDQAVVIARTGPGPRCDGSPRDSTSVLAPRAVCDQDSTRGYDHSCERANIAAYYHSCPPISVRAGPSSIRGGRRTAARSRPAASEDRTYSELM